MHHWPTVNVRSALAVALRLLIRRAPTLYGLLFAVLFIFISLSVFIRLVHQVGRPALFGLHKVCAGADSASRWTHITMERTESTSTSPVMWPPTPSYTTRRKRLSDESDESGYFSDRIPFELRTSDWSTSRRSPDLDKSSIQDIHIEPCSASAILKASTPTPDPSKLPLSILSSPSPSVRNTSVKTSRELVFELWRILQEQDEDKNTYPALHTDDGIEHWAHGIGSPRTATTGSRTSNSPKSSTTSTSTSVGDVNKTNIWAIKRGSEDKDEDEGASRKKSKDDQDSFAMESLQQPNNQGQMTCPLLESHECQGTNTTISELLRSLMHRHRIVICKECCERITIEDEEKKPANVLKKHATGCQRRCIGSSCVDSLDESASHHRRTEGCPSWATLAKEARWTFIWTLVNPESTPPDPIFLPGPAFEHSQEKRLCKQQARTRRNEICAQLMRDVEAKEVRIITLEKDLAAAKNDNAQLLERYNGRTLNLQKDVEIAQDDAMQVKERCDGKILSLESIIEDLLERLNANGSGIPASMRRRLHNECPTVTVGISALRLQTDPQSLSTLAFPSSYGHYPWVDMSLTTPNTFLPPPPLSSIPNISVFQDTALQQVVGLDAGGQYPGLDLATTTNPTYQVEPYTSAWPYVGGDTVGLGASDGEYTFSAVLETAKPHEESDLQ